MAGEYDPDEFDDEYREAVVAVVEGKLDKGESSKVPEEPGTSSVDSGQVLDLMAALQRSVDAAKGKARAGRRRPDDAAAKPAKKAAAKWPSREQEAPQRRPRRRRRPPRRARREEKSASMHEQERYQEDGRQEAQRLTAGERARRCPTSCLDCSSTARSTRRWPPR